jgi:hypothetical protein
MLNFGHLSCFAQFWVFYFSKWAILVLLLFFCAILIPLFWKIKRFGSRFIYPSILMTWHILYMKLHMIYVYGVVTSYLIFYLLFKLYFIISWIKNIIKKQNKTIKIKFKNVCSFFFIVFFLNISMYHVPCPLNNMSTHENWRLNEEGNQMSKFFKIGNQNRTKQNRETKIVHFVK